MKKETFDLYAEIEKSQKRKIQLEILEWCEKTHIRFDDYGIRTAKDTLDEYYEWIKQN